LRSFLRYGRSLRFKRLLVRCLESEWNSRPSYDFNSTTYFGSRVAGNTRDVIPFFLHVFGILEENLSYWFEEQLQPGDCFVDVGAHVGYFSLLASKAVGPNGRVVAIEASPKTFAELRRNLALNPHCRNVRAVNVAASDAEGTAAVYRGPDNGTGISSIHQRLETTLETHVQKAPLSRILTEEELRTARMVKIDVEGSEFATIAGILPVVNDCRHVLEIVVETSLDWRYQGRRATIADLLDVFSEASFNGYLLEKECEVDRSRFSRPTRIDMRHVPDWKYCDIVFSRRNQNLL
jgi:FkbM family methyltransferase